MFLYIKKCTYRFFVTQWKFPVDIRFVHNLFGIRKIYLLKIAPNENNPYEYSPLWKLPPGYLPPRKLPPAKIAPNEIFSPLTNHTNERKNKIINFLYWRKLCNTTSIFNTKHFNLEILKKISLQLYISIYNREESQCAKKPTI